MTCWFCLSVTSWPVAFVWQWPHDLLILSVSDLMTCCFCLSVTSWSVAFVCQWPNDLLLLFVTDLFFCLYTTCYICLSVTFFLSVDDQFLLRVNDLLPFVRVMTSCLFALTNVTFFFLVLACSASCDNVPRHATQHNKPTSALCSPVSLSLAGNSSRLTWARHRGRKSSATHSYQCVQYFPVS